MLWAVFTLIAAAAQTARNAMQRELTATLGPVPQEEVAEYLDVLARLGVLERVSG